MQVYAFSWLPFLLVRSPAPAPPPPPPPRPPAPAVKARPWRLHLSVAPYSRPAPKIIRRTAPPPKKLRMKRSSALPPSPERQPAPIPDAAVRAPPPLRDAGSLGGWTLRPLRPRLELPPPLVTKPRGHAARTPGAGAGPTRAHVSRSARSANADTGRGAPSPPATTRVAVVAVAAAVGAVVAVAVQAVKLLLLIPIIFNY
ncbi:hypothetical protein P170DRAFT_472161 [Aspergillus steynii IBT 23096]|uniref:Uncharacterized protein n=1 Tax=Aspergillus steynii IBT 23096 TaxID=1392250 RepID=A0A2I2GHA3_9EURO|nr:uncharacterized protein P170DRAFT_472161 [Aspergillus steynii IBT 23096]PLB52254.1 hypothetical protein P170DRAFT_472161 [Aspergillus steynii IBT 23096]